MNDIDVGVVQVGQAAISIYLWYVDGNSDVDAEERRGGLITLSFLFQLWR